jgi:hypothetical protein
MQPTRHMGSKKCVQRFGPGKKTLNGSGQNSRLGEGAMLTEMNCLRLIQDRALWFSHGKNGDDH